MAFKTLKTKERLHGEAYSSKRIVTISLGPGALPHQSKVPARVGLPGND